MIPDQPATRIEEATTVCLVVTKFPNCCFRMVKDLVRTYHAGVKSTLKRASVTLVINVVDKGGCVET